MFTEKHSQPLEFVILNIVNAETAIRCFVCMLSVVPRNTVHDVVNNAYYAVMGHNENVSVVITVFFDKIFEPCFDPVKKSMGTFTVGVRLVETEGAEKNARIFAQCIGVQHSAEFAVVDFAQAWFGVHEA